MDPMRLEGIARYGLGNQSHEIHACSPSTALLPLRPTGAAGNGDVMASATYALQRRRSILWWSGLLGPGIMVMLADTDAGSVITAAQSGAQWGYALLLPQLLLIPVVFAVQEMTVRLGVVTGKGHGALIREHFGLGWALLSAGTLFIACIGALITEFLGIAGVGQLFGIPPLVTVPAAALLLIVLVLTNGYSRVERLGIAIGLLELCFIVAAVLAHPQPHAVAQGLTRVPIAHASYMFLVAANVGAVIMPWMVFFQQGAVIDRGSRRQGVRSGSWDTLIGSILTQVVMGAVVVTTAATIGRSGIEASLTTVGQIAGSLSPFLGWNTARIVFGLGLVGASFVAALVVSLAAAWGVTEVTGWKHSLNDSPLQARGFYWLYVLGIVGSAVLVLAQTSPIHIALDVEVMNAMLLPVVLGFLLLLEARVLPRAARMTGAWRYTVWTLTGAMILLGLCTAVSAVGASV